MSTEKTSSGAIRAAVEIAANHPECSDSNYVQFCSALAEIIDRQTHAGELLEALEAVAPFLVDFATVEERSARAQLRAAIRKARGE